MSSQLPYSAQYDDQSGKPIVLLRSDSLPQAVIATTSALGKNAYVLHVPTGLQRYVIGERVVWLDAHGREHKPPRIDPEENSNAR